MHAAVGVAQIKQLDAFIATQKKHYFIIEQALKTIPEVTFIRIPVSGEQNYSFLNIFLPTKQVAKKIHTAFVAKGVDATFYWFDNNWHYHTKWEHLKHLNTLSDFSNTVYSQLPNYDKVDFSASDAIMSRTISCLIKLSWSQEEVQDRANKMATIIKATI